MHAAERKQSEGAIVIIETIVSTRDESARDHIAPMGIHQEPGFIVISPFRPSTTLDYNA